MTKKFKLSTAPITGGVIKGWSTTSALTITVKNHLPEDRQELIEAIKKQLVKAQTRLDEAEKEIMTPRAKRGSSYGDKISARFNRAHNAVNEYKRALEQLENA